LGLPSRFYSVMRNDTAGLNAARRTVA